MYDYFQSCTTFDIPTVLLIYELAHFLNSLYRYNTSMQNTQFSYNYIHCDSPSCKQQLVMNAFDVVNPLSMLIVFHAGNHPCVAIFGLLIPLSNVLVRKFNVSICAPQLAMSFSTVIPPYPQKTNHSAGF